MKKKKRGIGINIRFFSFRLLDTMVGAIFD